MSEVHKNFVSELYFNFFVASEVYILYFEFLQRKGP